MDKDKLYTWLSQQAYPVVMGVLENGRKVNITIESIEHALSFDDVAPNDIILHDNGHRDNWLAFIDSLEPSKPDTIDSVSLESVVTRGRGRPRKDA